QEDLRVLAETLPHAVILLDGAYAEFAETDLWEQARKLRNEVMVRSFSKAKGLPGARLGYALGDKQVIEMLARAGGPYNVAGISLELGQQAIANQQVNQKYIDAIKTQRHKLEELLQQTRLKPWRSQANF